MRNHGRGQIYLGTAAWSIPKGSASRMTGHGSHLERYSRGFDAVEINTSFYKPHRPTTYIRWSETTPSGFRFSVKVPKQITHGSALVDCEELMDRFLGEANSLGEKLGPLLIQLPPSQVYEPKVAQPFFELLRSKHVDAVACEPRHPSWFSDDANDLLVKFQVARVAADPAVTPAAAIPGGWLELQYYRWHGSPRIYYSDYSSEQLAMLAATLTQAARDAAEVWCIFDNTALGAATSNALDLAELLGLRLDAALAPQVTV